MYKIFIVALLSSFEIYVAIGTGLAFGLNAHTLCIATLVGGITGVFVSAFLGDKIKSFILKFKKNKDPKPEPTEVKENMKTKMLKNLWAKYGVFGVGFIGTFLVGAPISIGIGYGFGVQAKDLVKYCLVAVVIRCILYSYFFEYIKNLF